MFSYDLAFNTFLSQKMLLDYCCFFVVVVVRFLGGRKGGGGGVRTLPSAQFHLNSVL